MTQMLPQNVWEDSFEVTRGLLNRHVYVIPRKYVVEADGDVVDLTIDKQQVDGLEPTGQDEPVTLPDEYTRIEGLEDPKASRADDEDVLFRR